MSITSSRKTAFTLIELLVVISIISLLIAVLLPALQSARTTAQMTKSLSNIRQIMISHHMYANDYKGRLIPRAGTRLNSAGSYLPDWPYWPYVLTKGNYTASIDVFWSPARDTSSVNMAGMRSLVYNAAIEDHWASVGYAVNEWVFNFATPTVKPLQLGAAGNPIDSRTLALTEYWNKGGSNRAGYYFATPAWVGRPVTGAFFNYNLANVHAYVDGHAIAGPTTEMGWEAFDQYEGRWVYPGSSSFIGKAPWYRQWQNGIYN